MAEPQASSSYWEVEDYTRLTGVLRAHGVPIRLVKISKGYHVYDVNGLEVHVYRRLMPLGRYRISCDCAQVINGWKERRRRVLWLVAYANVPTQPIVRGDVIVFNHNGGLHLVTPDTSVAGFVRLVELLSNLLEVNRPAPAVA